jgi:gas vesicle protein
MKNQVDVKNNSRWHGVRSFFSGVAVLTIGGLIGSSVALLYAPRSGRATRTMIYSRGMELKERIAEETHLASLQAKGQINHVRRDARYKAREIGSRLQNTRQDRQYAFKEAVGGIPLPFKHNGQ